MLVYQIWTGSVRLELEDIRHFENNKFTDFGGQI